MSGQTDNADIVRHVLAAELGAQANLADLFPHLFLKGHIAEGAAGLVTCGGEGIVIVSGSQLHGKKVLFRAGAANHKCNMVRRAGSGAKGLDFLYHERHKGVRIKDCLGHLVQVALICRSAAFHNAEELILHAFFRVDVYLCGQVALGIDLLVHVQGRVLTVTEIFFRVCLENAQRQGFLVVKTGPYLLAFLSVDNCGAGVLAERKLSLSGNLRIPEHHEGNVLVVVRCLRIVKDLCNLLIVRAAQEEIHIPECGICKPCQCLRRNLQYLVTLESPHGHPFRCKFIVFSGILTQLKHWSVFKLLCHYCDALFSILQI